MLCSVSFHDDFVEAFGMESKFQALGIRPPHPHGNLADLAANTVFDVILPHRTRLARKFQRCSFFHQDSDLPFYWVPPKLPDRIQHDLKLGVGEDREI